ncbi:hypothetical protein C8R45DRAFT_944326 [Mycena sanguinolenta]|nr:hypothetical protein C8R45DRAFT_944326 [Mycena sanguinolenta]
MRPFEPWENERKKEKRGESSERKLVKIQTQLTLPNNAAHRGSSQSTAAFRLCGSEIILGGCVCTSRARSAGIRKERKGQIFKFGRTGLKTSVNENTPPPAAMNEAIERCAHLAPCVCSAKCRRGTMRTGYEGHEEIADVDDGGAGRENGVGRATQRQEMTTRDDVKGGAMDYGSKRREPKQTKTATVVKRHFRLSGPAHTHWLASSSLPIFKMKRILKLLGKSKPRASSAPPSTRVPEPSAPSLTTLTRPASPQTVPAPLQRESPSSAAQTAWTNLKEVLKALHDGSDLYPPLKTALSGVTSVMDSIERVGDVDDEFVGIIGNVKDLQGILSQYGSAKDISPAICTILDAMISELKLIEEAASSKMQLTQLRHILEASGEVEKVLAAFKRFSNLIDELQVESEVLVVGLNKGLQAAEALDKVLMSISMQ